MYHKLQITMTTYSAMDSDIAIYITYLHQLLLTYILFGLSGFKNLYLPDSIRHIASFWNVVFFFQWTFFSSFMLPTSLLHWVWHYIASLQDVIEVEDTKEIL